LPPEEGEGALLRRGLVRLSPIQVEDRGDGDFEEGEEEAFPADAFLAALGVDGNDDEGAVPASSP
jgi:hypothetical protein